MRVHLDQSRHHHVVAGIDDAAGMQIGAMIDDLLDAIVANDDVDVGAQRRRSCRRTCGRRARRCGPAGSSGCHVRLIGTSVMRPSVTSTSFRPRGGLIQQPLASPRPTTVNRPGHRESAARRAGDIASRRRRHHVHHAVHHERHLRAIARPDRTVVVARADRMMRHGIQPSIGPAGRRHQQQLVGAFTKPRSSTAAASSWRSSLRAPRSAGPDRASSAWTGALRPVIADRAVAVDVRDLVAARRPRRLRRLGRDLLAPRRSAMSRTQRSIVPSRSDENAIDRPSGDQVGSISTKRSFVSRRAPRRRSASATDRRARRTRPACRRAK